MKHTLLFLVLFTTLAFVVRGYKLADRPSGFTWDEAALGYNAYSLLLTGKDEHGQSLPGILKSFGDYKPGLYAYLSVPSIAAIGLNEFATRLPSVISGTLLTISVFLLVWATINRKTGLLTALVLTVNPWATHFSRGAWEANVSLLLTTLGVTAFVRRKYYLASIMFGLTCWTYQGAKLFTPLVLILLLLINSKLLNLKSLLSPGIIGLAMVLPIVLGLGSQSGRLKVFSVFSYTRSDESIAEILGQDGEESKSWKYYLWHSQIWDYVRGIAQRYTNHLSPQFLFFTGDWTTGRHSIPYYGYFHLIEVIPLLIGVYVLIKRGGGSGWMWWGWILLAPIPAALSRDLVSGVRSLPLVVPVTVLIALGISQLVNKKLLMGVYSVIWFGSAVYMADLYFIHAPHFTARDWLAAYQPAVKVVDENYNNYQRIIFTSQFGQPYIFNLFYLRINPARYQGRAQILDNLQGDVGEVTAWDKFEFRPIFWPEDRRLPNTLFIGSQYDLPETDLDENVVKYGEINYSDGFTALKIVGTQ